MPTYWGAPTTTVWSQRVNPDKVKQANMTLILADGRLANPAPWGRIYGNYLPLRPSTTWSHSTDGDSNVRYWHSNGTTVNLLMTDYSVVSGVTEMEGAPNTTKTRSGTPPRTRRSTPTVDLVHCATDAAGT